MVVEAVKALSAEEISELCLRHTLYDWSVQAGLKPLAVRSAKGVHFETVDGRRFIDFNSQLMCVNAGHGDHRIIDAIKRQADLLPYISPFMATDVRARLGRKLAELLPGDIDKVLFTLGGNDANENAIKIARTVTGRSKILARYRSYHGATGTAIQATGDPRRWPNEHAVGVVHVLDPYHGLQRGTDTAEVALEHLEETIELEGPGTIAAFILEPVTGTNGILIPPDGYLQGVRQICDRHGILLIADEVMTGFGRTGRWFGIEWSGAAPDLMTCGKGMAGGYMPVGAVLASEAIVETVERAGGFVNGFTFSHHPVTAAAALATLEILERERLVERAAVMGERAMSRLQALRARPQVGDVRGRGLMLAVELVADAPTRRPFPRADKTAERVAARAFADGLIVYPSVGGATGTEGDAIMLAPPLVVTEDEIDEMAEILDGAIRAALG
jgi:taurine--2-oxoglutarate transaminase